MTIKEFSTLLGVTPAAVFLWESGERVPEGGARTLLRLLQRCPDIGPSLKEIAVESVREQLDM